MTLKNYLLNHYSKATAKAYERDINKYLQTNPKAKSATYSIIINYLDRQRRNQSPASLHRILQSIKKYYYYLIETKQREDHPCENIKIRDYRRNEIQLQDLFNKEELEKLLELKSRYQLLKNRNQLIITLLIYQALTTGELTRLEIENLNLEKGEIHIKKSNRLNARTLELKSNQILLAHNYINEDRVKLIKVKSNKLLITKTGTEEKGEGISYLISTQQRKYPNRKLNPKTIRQSVITNLLKQGKELRSTQLFAGHKNPSSTERYRQTNLESLKAAILKHHPLG